MSPLTKSSEIPDCAMAALYARIDFGLLFLFVHFPFGGAKGKWTNSVLFISS
jgi:hypothetical protein